MSTTLILDTPAGLIPAPAHLARQARDCTDQQLCDHLNGEGAVCPFKREVARKERPHVLRRRASEEGDRWHVKPSEYEAKWGVPNNLSDLVSATCYLLMQRDYWHALAFLKPGQRALLDLLERELQEEAGGAMLGRLLDVAHEELGKGEWAVHDAMKFARSYGAIRFAGRRFADLPRSARYEWTL